MVYLNEMIPTYLNYPYSLFFYYYILYIEMGGKRGGKRGKKGCKDRFFFFFHILIRDTRD